MESLTVLLFSFFHICFRVFPSFYMLFKIHKPTSAVTISILVVFFVFIPHPIDRKTLKELSRYGLDILRNEEDSQVCFGVKLVDNTVEAPIGVVVRHFEPEEIVDCLLPLKKMKYLGVDVLVPSNPIAFLEKLYEDKNDILKEVDLFKETSSNMDQWKKAGVILNDNM